MRGFFCKLCQNIIERGIKTDQLCNMDKTGFIHKQNCCKVVVWKDSINVWSKSSDTNFHMKFVVCVSAAETVSLPLLIVPGKFWKVVIFRVLMLQQHQNIFINSTLFLIFVVSFDNSVPDSVAKTLVLVYDGCCSHYNDDTVKVY